MPSEFWQKVGRVYSRADKLGVCAFKAAACHHTPSPPLRGFASFARSTMLSFVGFFIRGRAGTPVAFLPDIDVALLHPFAAQPDVTRMRTRPPMAGHPEPLAAPRPVAGNEIPKRPRAGTHGDDIFLVRGRRLGRLADIDVVCGRDLRCDVGRRWRRATRKQRGHNSGRENPG